MGRETTKQIKTLYTTPSKQNKTKQNKKLKQKSTRTKNKTETKINTNKNNKNIVNQNNYSPVTHETMAENKLCNV